MAEFIGKALIQTSLPANYAGLARTLRDSLEEEISTNIWEPHIKATRVMIPSGKNNVVCDSFPIVQKTVLGSNLVR